MKTRWLSVARSDPDSFSTAGDAPALPKRISKKDHRKAFTLIELLIIIVIIVLLVALLFPALERVRRQADIVKCVTQKRQLICVLNLYAGDHQGSYPYDPQCNQDVQNPHDFWSQMMKTMASEYDIPYGFWVCPAKVPDLATRNAYVSNLAFASCKIVSLDIYTYWVEQGGSGYASKENPADNILSRFKANQRANDVVLADYIGYDLVGSSYVMRSNLCHDSSTNSVISPVGCSDGHVEVRKLEPGPLGIQCRFFTKKYIGY